MRMTAWTTAVLVGALLCFGCQDKRASKRDRDKDQAEDGDREEKVEASAKAAAPKPDSECAPWLQAVRDGKGSATIIATLGAKECAAAPELLEARFGQTPHRRAVLDALFAFPPSPAGARIVEAALADPALAARARELGQHWKLPGLPAVASAPETAEPAQPEKQAKVVDPKKVGLEDMLGAKRVGLVGIGSTLKSNPPGMSDKMAIAMAGAGSDFVMGHGSGGMGFKGTGTGGGGNGGFGRIHGTGKIDTGGGTGMHGRLGRKGARRVGKIRIGRGKIAGSCKKGGVARVVRRRVNSIRACYEQRLQVNPKLAGKVTARWTIAVTGRVQNAATTANTLKDGAVRGCILRVIRRMTFPKPPSGVCVVEWPFSFKPSGKK